MTPFEKSKATEIKRKIGLPFTPYVVEGADLLRMQLAKDMILGNTLTTPGFYAPQGRVVRLTPKHQAFLTALTAYQSKGFRLTNFEMETAGYYSMARLLGHEALSVSTIVANRVDRKFSKNPNATINALIRHVLHHLTAAD